MEEKGTWLAVIRFPIRCKKDTHAQVTDLGVHPISADKTIQCGLRYQQPECVSGRSLEFSLGLNLVWFVILMDQFVFGMWF